MKLRAPALILSSMLAAACSTTSGSDAAARLVTTDAIRSQALGESRQLNIWLPPDYAAGDERYPVVYLLDGGADEDYHHVSGVVQWASMYERMPKSIVVGIVNVDRYRDFSHATSHAEDLERLPTGGGSARFLAFVENELIPHVEANYRTTSRRMLIGQSMGGLLAAEVLLTRPQLFDDYLIVSPSLWWGRRALLDRAVGDLSGRRAFVALGREHEVMHEVADALVARLRGHEPAIDVGYETLRDETHATVLHQAVYRGLRFFYGATHPGM